MGVGVDSLWEGSPVGGGGMGRFPKKVLYPGIGLTRASISSARPVSPGSCVIVMMTDTRSSVIACNDWHFSLVQ